VPAWMVVVIVLRELAVTGLRGIASSGGVTLAAEELGKYKMILQMFALEALLLHYRYPIPGTGLEIDFHAGGMLFLRMALVLAVSGDGAHVYVTDRLASSRAATLSLLRRDPGTGALTPVEFEADGVRGVNGLFGATALALSPDGENIYVAAEYDSAVVVFRR